MHVMSGLNSSLCCSNHYCQSNTVRDADCTMPSQRTHIQAGHLKQAVQCMKPKPPRFRCLSVVSALLPISARFSISPIWGRKPSETGQKRSQNDPKRSLFVFSSNFSRHQLHSWTKKSTDQLKINRTNKCTASYTLM